MTYKQKILDYLRQKNKATIRELTFNLWIQTPQEYIRQLRSEGYNIETRYFNNDKHCTYVLHEKPQHELFI